MRKVFLILVVMNLAVLSNVALSAEERIYVSLGIGAAMLNDATVSFDAGPVVDFEFKDGFIFIPAIGWIITDNLRGELEFSLLKADLDKATIPGTGTTSIKGDISGCSLLMNGYFDFINRSPVTPFLSAGIGFSNVEVSDIGIPGSPYYIKGDDDFVFAYQLSAGIGIGLHEYVMLDIAYRYFATSDPGFDFASAEISANIIYAGFRFLIPDDYTRLGF